MSDQQLITQEPPVAADEWFDEDAQELPPRPRRRLLGKGTNRVAVALLGVLLCACGFIAGVLVEKGQGGSSSAAGAAGSFAARFAAARSGSSGSTATGGGLAGLFGASGASRPTAGTVAYIDGSTLYVTNSEGNTIKVTTSAGTSVHKTVSSTVASIHPGETVTVTGASATNGAVSAESISVGSGGGLAALFGAGGLGRSGTGTTGSSGTSGSASSQEPALFGK
jgi:hypothetical protein